MNIWISKQSEINKLPNKVVDRVKSYQFHIDHVNKVI